MPKKKRKESASGQAARFAEEAQKLIDAGDLSPEEADKALEGMLSNASDKRGT